MLFNALSFFSLHKYLKQNKIYIQYIMSSKLEVTHNKNKVVMTRLDKSSSCAKENERFSLPKGSGTIYYGADGPYMSASYNTNSDSISYMCNFTTFGDDPAPGVEKNCWLGPHHQDYSPQHQPLTREQINAGCVCHV